MNNKLILLALTFSTIFLSSCAGGSPGYWFSIVFIILPIIIVGVILYNKIDGANDSLYIIEGQLKRLSNKVEALEEKIDKTSPKKESKKTTTSKDTK